MIRQLFSKRALTYSGSIATLIVSLVTVLRIPSLYCAERCYTNGEVGMVSWEEIKRLGDLQWPKVLCGTFTII